MGITVMYFLVLVLCLSGIHARVAVTDSVEPLVSNEIHNNTIPSEKSGYVTTIEYVKEIKDVNNNSIDTNETLENPVPVIDNGTALILTPYIKEGKIEEARIASKVNPDLFLGVESYSGFYTVNETYNSNIFFWYFPVEKKPVNETPWMIWLQGGPGASSLTGLFEEIGPFAVVNKTLLKRNPNTWVQDSSLLFIDNPVGTGYSFTNNKDGYVTDMDMYAKHLYSTVKQFLQLFPELRTAPLIVAGESYAGKYVPALGMQLHKHKNTPGGDVNLQGLLIGNAYVEPGMIYDITRPYYQFGLLDKQQLELMQPLVDAYHADILAKRSVEAKTKFNSLVVLLLHMANQRHAYNFLQNNLNMGLYLSFLHQSEIKKALHVGDIRVSFVNSTVHMKLAPDFLSDARPIFEELLEHYRVMAYCGQLDQMLTCPIAAEHHGQWRWSGSEEFRNATRFSFMQDGKRAGYHKSGGRLTEAVLVGAGHMAAADTPRATRQLVASWVRGRQLPYAPQLPRSMLREYVANNTQAHTTPAYNK